MRSRNNHLSTWLANISTAVRYGAKYAGSASFSETVFFGYGTAHNTLLRNTAKYRYARKNDNMVYTDQCRSTIRTLHGDFIIISMDNNQHGQNEGSNEKVVVTSIWWLRMQ